MAGNKLKLTINVIEKFLVEKKSSVDENFILNSKLFNSLIRDRIRVELLKIDVDWDDTKDVSILNLVNNESSNESKIVKTKKKYISEFGIDIQSISELPETKDYWKDDFYKNIFSDYEIAYALGKINPLETFAGIYAIKEAIYKSNNNEEVNSIELDYSIGKPLYKNYILSVSHSNNYAIASALYLDAIESRSSDKLKKQIEEYNNENNNLIENINKQHKKQKYLLFILTITLITYIFLNELF